jgi:hypothetical protein
MNILPNTLMAYYTSKSPYHADLFILIIRNSYHQQVSKRLIFLRGVSCFYSLKPIKSSEQMLIHSQQLSPLINKFWSIKIEAAFEIKHIRSYFCSSRQVPALRTCLLWWGWRGSSWWGNRRSPHGIGTRLHLGHRHCLPAGVQGTHPKSGSKFWLRGHCW